MTNDTYGEIDREDLNAMRSNAKPCTKCGMLATVDPIMHETRYGHAPVIRDGSGELYWSTDAFSWLAYS